LKVNNLNKNLLVFIAFIYGFNGQISEFFPESLIFIKAFVAIFDIVIIFYALFIIFFYCFAYLTGEVFALSIVISNLSGMLYRLFFIKRYNLLTNNSQCN